LPGPSPSSSGSTNITQIVFGRSAVKGWRKYLYLTAVQRFLKDAPPIDVHIVTQKAGLIGLKPVLSCCQPSAIFINIYGLFKQSLCPLS